MLLDKRVLSFDKSAMSLDKTALSFDKSAMSLDKIALSFDKGALSFDKGALSFSKRALPTVNFTHVCLSEQSLKMKVVALPLSVATFTYIVPLYKTYPLQIGNKVFYTFVA